MHLPFEANSFHACTLSFGIRNMKDRLVALEEIYRVVRPRGRALILELSMPRSILKWPYLFYLRYVLPYVGSMFTKEFSAYRHLNQTIESFPSPPSFVRLMRKAKFRKVHVQSMALGAVSLYIGEKDG